jgi:hypothetical protein
MTNDTITLTREEAQQVLSALESDNPDIQLRTAITLRAKIRRIEVWESRDLTKCGCDHNEYCEHCWPLELRKEKNT